MKITASSQVKTDNCGCGGGFPSGNARRVIGMMDVEERRETGSSLMFVGLGIWMMDLMVAFFLPSGIQYGHRAMFMEIIVAMGSVGLIALAVGYKIRGKSSAE